jgi:hypothetical protein
MLQLLLGFWLATMPAAQAGSTPPATAPSQSKPDTKTPLTLTGCVSRDGTTPNSFTFADSSTGSKYRLSGASVRKYAGQRVVIVGGPERRLTVRGGLVPSANAAAQAGNQDPVQAAIAGMPGAGSSGVGTVALPTFRVTRVQPADGKCE